jgi:hypothetical protein
MKGSELMIQLELVQLMQLVGNRKTRNYFLVFLIFIYFLKINFKLYTVIIITIINQIIIQTELGKIPENFDKSELGQTEKSSIIYNRLETHKNCKIKLSYFVYLAKANNPPAKINKIKLERIELNQNIATKIINQAIKYNIF